MYYEEIGEAQLAFKDFTKCIELDSLDANAWLHRGDFLFNNEQIDTKMFTYQGLGRIVSLEIDLTLHQETIVIPPPPDPDPIIGIVGCMDPNATNYDPAATINDVTLCSYVAPPPPPAA